jgi:dUTP pyrophosphatase
MITFEKVNKEVFFKSVKDCGYCYTDEQLSQIYNDIKLPARATTGSAGYDIFVPVAGFIEAGETLLIPTGIKAIMPQNVALLILPRSGIGFKTGIRLSNTIGLIDSDYQFADNDGHIMIKLTHGYKDYEFKIGDRIAQAIFINYLTTDDDAALQSRSGGIGSTGK